MIIKALFKKIKHIADSHLTDLVLTCLSEINLYFKPMF